MMWYGVHLLGQQVELGSVASPTPIKAGVYCLSGRAVHFVAGCK